MPKSADKIGDWDKKQLAAFVERAVSQSVPALPPAVNVQVVSASQRLVIGADLEISDQAVEVLRVKLGL